MSSDFVLPPELYDVAWDRLPNTPDSGGLRFSRTPKLDEFIVKLRFMQGDEGGAKTGTGFYINIPQAESYVILTAGHNLIDGNKNVSKDLVIQTSPEDELPIEHEGKGFFIAASYRDNPSDSNAENDFGAILVPKEKGSKNSQRGFGFALKLGHDDLHEKDVAVSGYQGTTAAGEPLTSTGECINCSENQLVYEVETKKGLSGSPVFMPYRGHETAIAVHNHGPRKRGRGSEGTRLSKGTRLNDKVLEEIFDWVKVGYRDRSLKVFFRPKPPLEDLYLHFVSDPVQRRGWVRSGYDGLETRFDILPAYAPPPPVTNKPLYVFRFLPPQGWLHPKAERWVLWDIQQQCVTLTSALQEFCFPRIHPNPDKESFWIVLEIPRDKTSDLMELQMRADDLQPEDIEMGEKDTPEVSFAIHLKDKSNKVCFR